MRIFSELVGKLWSLSVSICKAVLGPVRKISSIFFYHAHPLLPLQNPAASTSIITEPLLLHNPLISSPTIFDDFDEHPACEDRVLWCQEEIYWYQTIDHHVAAEADTMHVFVEENETPFPKKDEEEKTKKEEKKNEEEKEKEKKHVFVEEKALEKKDEVKEETKEKKKWKKKENGEEEKKKKWKKKEKEREKEKEKEMEEKHVFVEENDTTFLKRKKGEEEEKREKPKKKEKENEKEKKHVFVEENDTTFLKKKKGEEEEKREKPKKKEKENEKEKKYVSVEENETTFLKKKDEEDDTKEKKKEKDEEKEEEKDKKHVFLGKNEITFLKKKSEVEEMKEKKKNKKWKKNEKEKEEEEEKEKKHAFVDENETTFLKRKAEEKDTKEKKIKPSKKEWKKKTKEQEKEAEDEKDKKHVLLGENETTFLMKKDEVEETDEKKWKKKEKHKEEEEEEKENKNEHIFVEENTTFKKKKTKEKKQQKKEEETERSKKKSVILVVEERWIKHYCSRHRILLVGEGNFAFSACLADAFHHASNIIATSLDSEAFLKENYREALSNIEELRSRGSTVLHEIDATTMASHHLLRQLKFDRVIFNFPYAGLQSVKNLPRQTQVEHHQRLVRKFMENAREMMSEEGEIHIMHKTNSFHADWRVISLARRQGLRLIESVDFEHGDYPGYYPKCGFGGNGDFSCYPSKTYKFGLSSQNSK